MRFQRHCKLVVQGTLLAEGTADKMITFTVVNMGESWHGIRFDNSFSGAMDDNDTSRLVYCKLEYGKAFGNTNIGDDGGAVFVKDFSPKQTEIII